MALITVIALGDGQFTYPGVFVRLGPKKNPAKVAYLAPQYIPSWGKNNPHNRRKPWPTNEDGTLKPIVMKHFG